LAASAAESTVFGPGVKLIARSRVSKAKNSVRGMKWVLWICRKKNQRQGSGSMYLAYDAAASQGLQLLANLLSALYFIA
jgi:hypothetical protein